MRCKHCGFEMQETLDRCPACGKLQSDPVEPEKAAPVSEIREEPAPQEQETVLRYNRMSVIGFILSCSSLVIALFGLNALVGLICSIVGLSELRFFDERGKGLAIAGVALAIVSLVINALAIVYLLQLIASGDFDRIFSAARSALPN